MEYRLKYWVQLQPPLGINMFPPHSFVKMPVAQVDWFVGSRLFIPRVRVSGPLA